jgi:hypothetical protein
VPHDRKANLSDTPRWSNRESLSPNNSSSITIVRHHTGHEFLRQQDVLIVMSAAHDFMHLATSARETIVWTCDRRHP